VISIFFFCYWKILIVIRRQARVMAGHSEMPALGTAATRDTYQRS